MKHSVISAVVTAACAASIARAQETNTLPKVVIEGLAEPSLTVPSIVAATENLARVAGGTTLVRGEDIRLGRASTLRDALDFAPGVYVQSRFGAEEARISIRGSGLQRTFHGRGLKVLQDGTPINLADGSFDMQAIEPLSARYIEVWRGANGLRYGGTTLGGAINFVTPTGYDADPLQGRVEVGSYGYIRSQVSSGTVIGKADYYASFSHFAQDGYRQHAEQEAQRLFANVGYRITEQVENRLWFAAVKTDSQLPGSLSLAQALNAPRTGVFAGDQKRDFTLYRVSDRLAWSNGDSDAQLTGFWSHKDLDHPIFQVIDQNSNDFGLEGRFNHHGTLAGHDNRLTAGVSPVFGRTEDERFVNGAFTGQPRRGARTGDSTQDSFNIDTWVEDALSLGDRWTVSLGSSLNFSSRKFDDHFLADGNQTDTQEYLGFNPKLGMIYEFAKKSQLYANVSRNFEPPSFGELTRPAIPGQTNGLVQLDAQTGTTIEVGTRGEIGRFNWDLSVYQAWLDNELLGLQVGSFNPPVTQTINAGRTIHRGVELGLGARVFEGMLFQSGEKTKRDALLVQVNALYNDFRFDGDRLLGDNRLPGVPRHYLRAEVRYESGNGFYFGPNVEWAPESYPVDMANNRSANAPGYAILGVRAGYRTKKGLGVFFDARNLTDEAYVATTGVLTSATPASVVYNPGDGRTFYGGLEIRF